MQVSAKWVPGRPSRPTLFWVGVTLITLGVLVHIVDFAEMRAMEDMGYDMNSVGSVVFGLLGDVVGRRASFILTALIFAATAICGLMPSFPWQVGTCFVMGLAAGGELPVIYTMLAETMPKTHRGWMSVAVGGLGGLSGLLVASTLATVLEPAFSWRVLFLANLPTALFMLLLLRWVPESPRFLMHRGFYEEARRVMTQVGVAIVHPESMRESAERATIHDLARGAMRGTTLMLCLYGLAWGLCNWGFITWLPTMLRNLGHDPALSSRLLLISSFCALPGTLVAAWLYGRWSSKRTAVVAALITSAALAAFALAQPVLASQSGVVAVLVIALLVASSSMIGVLAPYSTEVFPTALRGVGSGVVTGSSKAGGIVAPALVGILLTHTSGLALPAVVVSVPIGLAGLIVAWRGVETRGRSLEELSEM